MQGSWLMAFVILAFLRLTKSSMPTEPSAHYWKCRKGDGIFHGNILKTLKNTHLRCFADCSNDPACVSLNVCPSKSSSRLSDCELMTNTTRWFCRELDKSSQNSECYYAEKTSKCGKGHRLQSNDTCRCDLCFRGPDCKLHVRDCKEAWQLANLAGGYNGQLGCFIQPNGAPSPFLAKCALWGKSTTFLVRVQDSSGKHWTGIQWATKSWDEYVKGFGSLDTFNYFVGLENLRLLLSQAAYRLNVYSQYQPTIAGPCSAAYANVTLGVEYALNYALHTICNGSEITGINGFYKNNTLHHFCTVDKDCGTCAKTKGPGWYYNPGCVGYSPFAPIAKWPYFSNGIQTIADTQWYIERDGDLFKP